MRRKDREVLITRSDIPAKGSEVLVPSQIFSCSVWPYSVNMWFIILSLLSLIGMKMVEISCWIFWITHAKWNFAVYIAARLWTDQLLSTYLDLHASVHIMFLTVWICVSWTEWWYENNHFSYYQYIINIINICHLNQLLGWNTHWLLDCSIVKLEQWIITEINNWISSYKIGIN